MIEIVDENAVTDLFGLIEGYNVLFAYDEYARMPELAYCIGLSLLEKNSVPMYMISFTEQSNGVQKKQRCCQSAQLFNDAIYSNSSKFIAGGATCIDMTEMLIKIEANLQEGQLLFLEDLGFLKWRHNKMPFMRFIDLLASRVKDKKGTMMCAVALNMFDTEVQKFLFEIFDTVLYITGDAIQLDSQKSKDDIQYAFLNDRLILKPAVSTDFKKVKEIFSLSPEEIEELDKIVCEQIEEYRKA